jgi:hypothetical protein
LSERKKESERDINRQKERRKVREIEIVRKRERK